MNKQKRTLLAVILLACLVVTWMCSSCQIPEASVGTDSQEETREQIQEEQTQEDQTLEEQTNEEQTREDQTDEEQTREDQTDEEQTLEDQTDGEQTREDQTDEEQIESIPEAESDTHPPYETPDCIVHSYDDGVVVKEATCTEEGIEQRTCGVCGDILEISIPKKEIAYTIIIDGETEVYVAADGAYSMDVPQRNDYKFAGYFTEDGEPFAMTGTIDANISVKTVFDTLRGLSFSTDERVYMPELLGGFPQTFGAKLKLPSTGSLEGVIFSNSARWDSHISYQINKNGNPCIEIGNIKASDTGAKYYNSPKTYKFDKVVLTAGSETEIFFVIDVTAAKMHCYVNGTLAQTISNVNGLKDECHSVYPFVVGGNTTGSNYAHFKGEILAISAWSDILPADQIAKGTLLAANSSLLARYDFYGYTEGERYFDLSDKGQNLLVDKLWLDESEVEPATGDYSFAIIGDTQSLIKYHPDEMAAMYDWILEHQTEFNIQYVMGLGDVTEDGKAEEFAFAKENIYKLNGKIPFSIAIGNHDKYDENRQLYTPDDYTEYLFNQYFYDETYLAQLDGWYAEGDVTNTYKAFELGSTKWLLVNLEFGPNDAVLEWASNIIADHPDHKVIITTHAYLYRDGTTVDANDCYPASGYNSSFNDGDQMFEKLISQHENIALVISGHDPHDHIVCTQVEGKNGNTVTQLLIDPQYMDAFYGATGMVALLHFSEADNTMTIRYYSTAKDMYGSAKSQFTVNFNLD